MEMEDFNQNRFVFHGMNFENFSELAITKNSSQTSFFKSTDCQPIIAIELKPNEGTFTHKLNDLNFPLVTVIQQTNGLSIHCTCTKNHLKLCENQALVLTAIYRRDDFLIFFNTETKLRKLKKIAEQYGLENEKNCAHLFRLEWKENKPEFIPENNSLIPITTEKLNEFKRKLNDNLDQPKRSVYASEYAVILRSHSYSNALRIDLVEANFSQSGRLKNSFRIVEPSELLWRDKSLENIYFFAGIQLFQQLSKKQNFENEIDALRAIFKNPLGYSFYISENNSKDSYQLNSLKPIKISTSNLCVKLKIQFNQPFYSITGKIQIDGLEYEIDSIEIWFNNLLKLGDTFYLIAKIQEINVLKSLIKKGNKWQIHSTKFDLFRSEIMEKLAEKIEIEYCYLPSAPRKFIQNEELLTAEKIIYLVDSENYIDIIPVVKYGEIEVPIRSKKVITVKDEQGNEFVVKRNQKEEIRFITHVFRQHPHLEEQLENEFTYFYLHKKHFLDEDWFLKTAENWIAESIQIQGFNQLQKNNLNLNKARIDIKVLSGINWFNAEIHVKFGTQHATLKQLAKSIRNKSNYVQLDDGTNGIIPVKWIEKFSRFFNAGEIIDLNNIRIPKINFTAVSELFNTEELSKEVLAELARYREKFANFDSIQEVQVPKSLNATLRSYQKTGLNWLNFLDDFNFGGILADDMGLGKSIQIIAFMLLQREKVSKNCNLMIVPATLLFNWKAEFQKFAPTLKFKIHHGNQRIKNTSSFQKEEVILTTYGTLLTDIHLFKDFHFNYVFLDESQNIRNPETERYKAVSLIQSRNKIAITGTPVENSTLDLFAQFSIVCPGLLGSKNYFKSVYLSPVDHFKNTKRTLELKQKIRPFLLRRTKEEVATEIPSKKEIVVFCEMDVQQRKLYDTYEKKFREYIQHSTKFDLNKNSMYVLKGLTKLRQICDAPLLADAHSEGIPSAKIELLINQIIHKSPNHKILVFSQFVSMLKLIEKELKKHHIQSVSLTGQTKNRAAIVQDFQENSAIKVFLISLKAGGTGINLTEADYVYLVDPWWNPAVESQAINRIHRIGQTKNTLAIRLICPNTIEDKIRLLQESKSTLADELIQSEVNFLQNLSKEGLLALLSDLK